MKKDVIKCSVVKSLLVVCVISMISAPTLAIEETTVDSISPKAKKSKLFFNREKKQKAEPVEQVPEINKNLLRPNESPGLFTDQEKARRYYNSLEDAHRTNLEQVESDKQLIEKAPLKLPARIQKDDITIHINKVDFTDSKIFTEEELAEFRALIENKDVTAEDLNNLVGLINGQYEAKKVLTARAYLVESDLKDGLLRIELMEAKIGKVYVEGNKFNRKWFLKKMISKRDGEVLDLGSLENDLKTFNKNARSIKLSAQLQPGEAYGTTDVILKADEKIPYHFSASYDSFGRETTGLLRGGIMASADTLFGFQDRLTGAVNLSRSSTNPFVDYNVPINRKGTRAGLSYMYGNNHITSGQYQDFGLKANTHVFSGYVTHPLKDNERYTLNLNTSANIKLSSASISGFEYSDYKDYNMAVGLGGRYNFNKSILFGSLYSTNGIIEDGMRHFSNYFTKVNADGYYIHYLPKGIIATMKVGGQYSPNNIAYIEQYQVGGISSVRGYSESLLLAPSSYFTSFEMLFPIPFLPEEIRIPFKSEGMYKLRESVKFATFFDHGAVFPHEGKVKTTNFLASVGAGLRVAISKYITARAYVGMPLMNTSMYQQGNARFHFDLIVSPF